VEKIENISDITQCPVCKKKNLKRVLKHIDMSKSCKTKCPKDVLEALKEKSKNITLKNKKEYIKEKKSEERQENPETFKKKERERKQRQRIIEKEKNCEMFNKKERERRQRHKIIEKEKNSEMFKKKEREYKQKSRKNETPNERLKEFLSSTMHNAVFICICCHVRCFKSNVVQFTELLKEKISSQHPSILKACIVKEKNQCNFQTEYPHENWSVKKRDEEKSMEVDYICKTCFKYIKKNKMPPSCVNNGLEITETEEKLKTENLILTDLEGSLIAKTLLFMKIFLLPVTRWTGMKDKAVNVPIPDSSILNTIEMLPRTPKDAGLISVNLKRKKDFKNTHISQLINPDKIYRMLDKLKQSKNPHYQFYDDYSTFKKRCNQADPKGYQLIYDDIIEENLEKGYSENKINNNMELIDEILEMGNFENLTDSENEKDEEYEKINDPIQKFNFKYDKTVCFTEKYPEISVAPGEGQTPQDVLMDRDWDVKAFPHIHNANASNGLNQNREVMLTDQKYFIQRICNKETIMSKSKSYLYAAVSYLERKQLQRNINLAGTRGKKTVKTGGISYELQDGYRVLEGIKNTPRYWKTAKYEIIAKIENFGAFQFFFTLSCADMRWASNFAPLLIDMDYKLNYTIELNEGGHWEIKITGRKGSEDWRDIMDIIKEFDESQHELLRDNVLTSTRYFNHRVKQFISKILLSKDNPMNVKFYSYKVEFQQRGAGKN